MSLLQEKLESRSTKDLIHKLEELGLYNTIWVCNKEQAIDKLRSYYAFERDYNSMYHAQKDSIEVDNLRKVLLDSVCEKGIVDVILRYKKDMQVHHHHKLRLMHVYEGDWCRISCHPYLDYHFIREFKDKLDWKVISYAQKLSEPFLREFKDMIDWKEVSRYQRLSEAFIADFSDKLDWHYISGVQCLSESFMRRFKDKIDWKIISYSQRVSEPFIREFQDRIDWSCIFDHQRLSDDFVSEFKDKVDWYWILKNNESSSLQS